MRRAFCFLLLAGFTLTAFADHDLATSKVTVAQLEKILAEDRAFSDGQVADQIFTLQLTERLGAASFARIKAGLPGQKSRQALLALADSSEFLNLPADEIPLAAAPSPATQRQTMSLVVNYVTATLHQLPNFLATRETTRFEDSPDVTYGYIVHAPYIPLHFVSKTSQPVIYRESQELADTRKQGTQSGSQGLVTRGEFGPILSTVLLDAAEGKLAWSHWEEGADGLEAVFSYAVPAQKSHYFVHAANPDSHEYHEMAGYHGEITVDPASGAVRRLVLEADLAPNAPFVRSAIMVRYGAVEIGGKSFVCPLKSVALSLFHLPSASTGLRESEKSPVKTFLNDVAFEKYHRLASEIRILPADSTNLAAQSPVPTAEVETLPAASGEAAPAAVVKPVPQPTPDAASVGVETPLATPSTEPAPTGAAPTALAPFTLSPAAGSTSAPEPQMVPDLDSDPLRPLLRRGGQKAKEITFSVRALPANPQPARDAKHESEDGKPPIHYLVDFNVRPSELKLTLTPEGHYSGKLRFGLLVYQRYGTALKWAGGTLAVDLTQESYAEAQASGIPAHFEIDLPDEVLYLEAGIFDWSTRKVGMQEIFIDPAAEKKAK